MSTLMIVLFIVIGAVLLYAAVKGDDPRSIVKQALKAK